MSHEEYVQYIKNLAANFFVQNLWNTSRGKQAIDYLKSRGLTETTIRNANIGYSPGNRALLKHIEKHQEPIKYAIDTNLLVKSKRSGSVEDFFNDYIVVPIMAQGDAVSFTGRVIGKADKDSKKPKFLHLKGATRHLYNIDILPNSRNIMVVESIFNALSLLQWGYPAIACLGSSIPRSEIEALNRKQIYLVFDNDENNSGQKGAIRSAKHLYESCDVDPHIVTMPLGVDVNDYAQQHTKDDFIKLLTLQKTRFTTTGEFKEWQEQKRKQAQKAKYKLKDREAVEQLKMVPVTSILSDYGIRLEQSGNLLQCRCPLPDHIDTNGSFTVYPESNRVKCYSCGFFGDNLALVSKLENLSFKAAIQYVKDRYT